MKKLEHQEQSMLMDWWELAYKQYSVDESLLFAIPNGGLRNIAVALALKAEGVRRGVPDLFLAVPRGQFHGLFIEMKKEKGGVVSQAQKQMMEVLTTMGYQCAVCRGWNDAKKQIDAYLTETQCLPGSV